MTSIIDKVRQLAGAKSQERQQTYDAAVRSAATGEKVDAAKIVSLLDAAGKTADDFAADVAHLTERIRLRGVLDLGTNRERDRRSVKDRLDAIDREEEAAFRGFEQRREPIRVEARAIEFAESQAQNAKSRLFDTAGEVKQKRLNAAMASVKQLSEQMQALASKRRQFSHDGFGFSASPSMPSTIGSAVEERRQHDAGCVSRIDEQSAGLTQELRAAEAELAAAEADMYVP